MSVYAACLHHRIHHRLRLECLLHVSRGQSCVLKTSFSGISVSPNFGGFSRNNSIESLIWARNSTKETFEYSARKPYISFIQKRPTTRLEIPGILFAAKNRSSAHLCSARVLCEFLSPAGTLGTFTANGFPTCRPAGSRILHLCHMPMCDVPPQRTATRQL